MSRTETITEGIKDLGAWGKSGAKAAWRVLIYTVVAYSLAVGLFVLVALGFLHLIGIETGVPPQIKPLTITYGYLVMVLLVPAELLRQWLAARRNELLHVLDPENGDAGIRYLPPSVWDKMDVKTAYRDDSGEMRFVEKSAEYLHRVQVSVKGGSRTGWECEYYDEKSNTAYCTRYPGDVSGTEIRRNLPESVEYLKHRAAVKAEWHGRFMRNFTDILDEQVRSRVNYLLHTLGDSIVPSEGQSSLRDDIKAATGDAEIADIADGERSTDDEIEMDNPFQNERLSVQLSDEGDSQ